MRESGSPERRAPRETDCGKIGSAELLDLGEGDVGIEVWTSDDRAPRGYRERHAKNEWSAKARNHPNSRKLPELRMLMEEPSRGLAALSSMYSLTKAIT
jgi:hypothetical protein